jgi:peptide/nickel transport system permease protein
MLRFILKRIVVMPFMLLVVTFLLFMVINITPTDPAIALLPAEYTQEDVDAIHEEYGFNDPTVVQYWNWLKKVVQGDLGMSYQTSMPISAEISDRFMISVKLAFVSLFFVILIGLPLGVVCAVKQYTMYDEVINVLAKALGGIPTFLYIVMLTYVFSVVLGWLPSYGLTSPKHWILPVFASAMPPIGGMVRQSRSSMLDSIRQDFITTARSKGMPERTIIFKEALRNALLPIITMIISSISQLIGGAVVVENIFAIPGIGAYVVSAIQYKNTPAIMAAASTLAIIFMISMLILDISYAIADPRTKATFLGSKKRKKITVAKEAA